MKNRAFTLAEVLITLGIIGVVSAMTIPTLIGHINSIKYSSRFKKTLSTLNQAVKLAEAKYDINFATMQASGSSRVNSNDLSVNPVFDAFVASTMSGVQKINYPSVNTKFVSYANEHYQFADGVIFAQSSLTGCMLDENNVLISKYLPGGSPMPKSVCYGFIDVNGKSLPNREVLCSNYNSVTIASSAGSCIVKSKDMGDIFPVVFHDSVVEPLTDAGWYVLKNSK